MYKYSLKSEENQSERKVCKMKSLLSWVCGNTSEERRYLQVHEWAIIVTMYVILKKDTADVNGDVGEISPLSSIQKHDISTKIW